MVSISTKTGDHGKTSLADGSCLSKDSLVFWVLGDFDELSSWLGLLRANSNWPKSLKIEKSFLKKMQLALFELNSELAKAKQSPSNWNLLNSQFLVKIKQHQAQLTKSNKQLKKGFAYPGESALAAQIDIARTVCRRAERQLVALSKQTTVRPILLKIINRFSDYLWLLARQL